MRLNIQTEVMTDKTGFFEISKNQQGCFINYSKNQQGCFINDSKNQQGCFINDSKWKTITR